jgi:Ca-activated chloride channel homolog
MRYRYEDYPAELLRALLTYQELVKLFLQLVLQTGGDVDEALKWMKYLQDRGIIDPSIDLEEFRKELAKNEIVEDRDGKLILSSGGERRIRRSALEEIFSSLTRAGGGYHTVPRSGVGGELLPETRSYEFGDNPAAIDGVRTIGNAVRRDAGDIQLTQEDFEVHEEEHLTSCATVLAIDISHSMILYGDGRAHPVQVPQGLDRRSPIRG